MGLSRIAAVVGSLTLLAAMSVLPVESAAAQTPTTSVVIPSNNATVSGTSQVLDAAASSGTTKVQYEITGAALSDSVIATATPTIYGWLAKWNTTTVANGTYALQSVATLDGVSGTSAAVTITVNNPTPQTQVVIPANGASVSGVAYLDAWASPGVTQVIFEISGSPDSLVDSPIANATPTIYGWLGGWNTPAAVADGTYTINGVASYADGMSGTSPPVSLEVDNPATLAELVTTNQTGEGVATLDSSCSNAINLVANAYYAAGTQIIGDVALQIEGCYGATDLDGSFTVTTTNAGTLSGTASGPITDITTGNPSLPQENEVQFTLTLTVTVGTGPFAETTGSLQAVLTSPANASPTDIPFTVSVSVPAS